MNPYEDAIKTRAFIEEALGREIYIDHFPEECPFCHLGIEASFYAAYVNKNNSLLIVICKCPRFKCNRFFSSDYLLVENYKEWGFSEPLFTFNRCLSGNPTFFSTPDEIKGISPMFHEIYNQALVAEFHDLNEIAGMGMRKAVEFLVKDYCINYKHLRKEEIQDLLLGKCIDLHIEDPKVKDISKRAAWLGNDHSHYYKKWPEKSTEDFKEIIEAMIHFVKIELIHKKATNMKNRNK